MKITIKNTEVEIKSKMRAYLIYEEISGKVFNPKSLTEMMLYFYSLILANSPSIDLTFSEFMDYLDDHDEVLSEFNRWILEDSKVKDQFNDPNKKNKNQQ